MRTLVLRFCNLFRPAAESRVSSLIISKSDLFSAQPDELVIGYPSDLGIVEESWDLLSQALGETTYPNFIQNAGADSFVAIHWRLGDYVGNDFQGVVSWDSIYECLRSNNLLKKEVRVFTDSPDLAASIISGFDHDGRLEIVSSTIWNDLFRMTRARFFIGTNSQVSLLAAIALRKSRNRTAVFLPRPFFKTDKWKRFFRPPPSYRLRFNYYESRFMHP